MFYKMLNGKIVCVKKTDDEITFLPDISHDVLEDKTIPWLESDREIVRLPDYSFAFEDEPAAIVAMKAHKKDEIAAARYDWEISGIDYKNVHISTDREDQSMITAIALSATLNNDFTTVWKGTNGYINLTSQEILTLAYLVAEHVEIAFVEEKRLAELIDLAQTKEELNAIVWSLKI